MKGYENLKISNLKVSEVLTERRNTFSSYSSGQIILMGEVVDIFLKDSP